MTWAFTSFLVMCAICAFLSKQNTENRFILRLFD